MREAVLEVAPYLEDSLVPECDYLLWCPEDKCCGKRPTKEAVAERLENKQPVALVLNPDLEVRTKIVNEVIANDGYCPCMIERNEDTKCPCKPRRENIECICGLYVRK